MVFENFIEKNYILVRPVLIEKTTEANILEIDGILCFYDIPVKPHHIGEKGYDLVLVRLYNNDCVLWKYKISDNGAYPLDDIVATLENLPIEYVYDYIDQFNSTPLHIEDLYIESAEYFNQNIGDKVKVIRSLYRYDEGDTVTITGFNHRGDPKLISFDGDEDNQGFHISNLDITTSMEAKLDSNNKVIINKEVSDRKYSLFELKELTRKAWKDSNFMPYNNTHFENWFNENIKTI